MFLLRDRFKVETEFNLSEFKIKSDGNDHKLQAINTEIVISVPP